jgi:hypothetical protein
MPNADAVHTDFARSAARLAARIHAAMDRPRDANPLSGSVDTAPDPKAALAGVRILGADALAPYAFTGAPLPLPEAQAIGEAMRLFPLTPWLADPGSGPGPGPGPGPDPCSEISRLAIWRDWALVELAARHGHPAVSPDAPDVPRPATAGRDAVGDATAWRPWSVAMAQLSPLALPGLHSPLHEAAHRNAVALARGACLAMLRRDHALAARLGRWLAFLRQGNAHGTSVPIDPAALLDHVLLFGGAEPRTVLDAEIGRRLLKGETA